MTITLSLTATAHATETTDQATGQTQKVITGVRPIVSLDEVNKFYPVLGKTAKDMQVEWDKFAVYTDKQTTGKGISGIVEVVPGSAAIVNWYNGTSTTPLKYGPDETIWPVNESLEYDQGSFRTVRFVKLKIKDEFKDQYRFPRQGEGSVSGLLQEPESVLNFQKIDPSSTMSAIKSDYELDYALPLYFARPYKFVGDNGVKSINLPNYYERMGIYSKDIHWDKEIQKNIDAILDAEGKSPFYTLKDGYAFAGIYDSEGNRVDNLKVYDHMKAGLDANDKEKSAIGTYTIKTVPTIIQFEPTDPKNPADPKDPNIDKKIDEIKKDHPVTREDYVVVGFTTDGNGRLDGDKTSISFLVKKGLEFSKFNLPTYTPSNGYEFDVWEPKLPDAGAKIDQDVLYTAKFKLKPNKPEPSKPDTRPSTPGTSSGSDGNKAEYTGFYNSLDENSKTTTGKNNKISGTDIKSSAQYKAALPKTSDVVSVIPAVAGFSVLLIAMAYISYRKFSN